MNDPPPLPPPPFWRTVYFGTAREQKPDRLLVALDDITAVIASPIRRRLQPDGRWRIWGRDATGTYWIRVILLSDEETVHNAFRDRGFRP